MKTIIKSTVLFSAVSLLAACGGDEKSDNSVSQNYHNIKTTLQGSIFNANNGTRITDESLKVTLVQGTDYRSAKVRKGTTDFAGDYSIGDIPTSTNGGNITYRIISTATGFQPFEGTYSFNINTGGLQDNKANRVGNIYMYPLGSFASDIKVNISFNNEPVANATVLLNPQTNSNTATTDRSNTIFPAQNGFQGAQTVVTDASGVATFAAANLVLGGRYSINVLPTTHEGSQLALNTAAPAFTVGTTNNIVNIAMAETVPGNNNGLYVTSASNLDNDKITSGGVLTLSFSRKIALVDEKAITATLTNNTTAALDATSPGSQVTATVSADGKTLSLAANFATGSAPTNFTGANNATADNALMVNYSAAFIRIDDGSDNAVVYNVFALTAETGGNPNNSVQATAAF